MVVLLALPDASRQPGRGSPREAMTYNLEARSPIASPFGGSGTGFAEVLCQIPFIKVRVPAISGLNLHSLESREFIGEGSSPKSSSEVQTPGTKDMNRPTREMGFICPVKKPHPRAHRMETGKQEAFAPLIANHLLPHGTRKARTGVLVFFVLVSFLAQHLLGQ